MTAQALAETANEIEGLRFSHQRKHRNHAGFVRDLLKANNTHLAARIADRDRYKALLASNLRLKNKFKVGVSQGRG